MLLFQAGANVGLLKSLRLAYVKQFIHDIFHISANFVKARFNMYAKYLSSEGSVHKYL